MATLPLKHSVRNKILLLVFAGEKDFAQMQFTQRCIQYMVTSVSQDQQYMFGVIRLLVEEKVLLIKKDLADVLFRRLMQRLQQLNLSYGSDRRVSISV